MKIYVDEIPKKPEECLFCYNSYYYKNTKPQCHLKRGMICKLCCGEKCPYLEHGVSKIDLLFG